jgi:hypothetical protein
LEVSLLSTGEVMEISKKIQSVWFSLLPDKKFTRDSTTKRIFSLRVIEAQSSAVALSSTIS